MKPDNSIVAGFIYGSNVNQGSYTRVEFPIRQNQMSPNDITRKSCDQYAYNHVINMLKSCR